jgi:hypothetical protein
MIITDYLKGEKLTSAKSRFDIVASSDEYDLFERLLINKRGFNVGGHSINLVERPARWNEKNATLALTKGSHNITSLVQPDVSLNFAFGDIQGTSDALLLIFNADYRVKDINSFEIFIARGLKNSVMSLWNMLLDGELNEDLEILRGRAVTKNVTR